jgi:hypothetical protein
VADKNRGYFRGLLIYTSVGRRQYDTYFRRPLRPTKIAVIFVGCYIYVGRPTKITSIFVGLNQADENTATLIRGHARFDSVLPKLTVARRSPPSAALAAPAPHPAPRRGSPPSAARSPSLAAAARRPLLTGSRATEHARPFAAPCREQPAVSRPRHARSSPARRGPACPFAAPRRARSSPPRAARPCPLLTATHPPSTTPRRGHAVRRPLPRPLLTAPSNSNPPRLRTRVVDVLPRSLRYMVAL